MKLDTVNFRIGSIVVTPKGRGEVIHFLNQPFCRVTVRHTNGLEQWFAWSNVHLVSY